MPNERKQASVKIDADLLRKLRTIKNATEEDISDYLSRIARPIIDRDHKKALLTLQKRDVQEEGDERT